MDIITEFIGGLPDAILEVRDMPVSLVMLPVIGSNPPTGGSDSGFTMSFEFNGLSRSGVLCGEDFIRYRPFKDSPEEILVEEEFDWGALWKNVGIGLGVVTLVTGAVAYCATIAFTGGASAVFAPYVMGGLTAVGGSWLVVSQAEKDYARGEVSGTMTYINSALAGSAHGAIAGYAFCMAPYAAPALLYGTGAGYAGSMVGLSEEMMISLAETALYAVNFSNIVVQGSDMVESTTGKNALRDALGDDLYRMVGQISETGAAVTVIAGLSNPDYYVKNNQAAHFEQVPRTGEGGTSTSLRDLMTPEETARYDAYWNNVADDMLKSNINSYRQAILNGDITKPTGGKINSKVVTAAIDTNTGDIYYGISGMNNNPTRNAINPQMQAILDSVDGTMTNYPLENCGEFNAINNALNNGVEINALRVYSINRVGGNYKAPCINCQNLYGNIVYFTE